MKRLFSWTKSLAIALMITLMVFANHPSAKAADIETLPGGNYSRALENSSDYVKDIRESGRRDGGGYWNERGNRSSVGRNDSGNFIQKMRGKAGGVNLDESADRAKNSAKRAVDNIGNNTKDSFKRTADDIRNNDSLDRAANNMKRAADNASDDNLIDRTQSKLEDLSDNVREKLNLDQPVPDSTKRFLNDTRSNFEDTVEPLTGKDKGFYQENIERNRNAVGE